MKIMWDININFLMFLIARQALYSLCYFSNRARSARRVDVVDFLVHVWTKKVRLGQKNLSALFCFVLFSPFIVNVLL